MRCELCDYRQAVAAISGTPPVLVFTHAGFILPSLSKRKKVALVRSVRDAANANGLALDVTEEPVTGDVRILVFSHGGLEPMTTFFRAIARLLRFK